MQTNDPIEFTGLETRVLEMAMYGGADKEEEDVFHIEGSISGPPLPQIKKLTKLLFFCSMKAVNLLCKQQQQSSSFTL